MVQGTWVVYMEGVGGGGGKVVTIHTTPHERQPYKGETIIVKDDKRT